MPLDVENFTAKISSMGLESPKKFEVDISYPSLVGIGEILNLMCETATIAGRTVQSMLDIQYGIRREIAYGAPQYTPLSLTFLCSEEMEEKKILDKWNNVIVDATRTTGAFNVAYYDDYVGEMNVAVLDRHGGTIRYQINYHKIWPKTVTSIDLNHATQNATMRVTAEMTYENWSTNSVARDQNIHVESQEGEMADDD